MLYQDYKKSAFKHLKTCESIVEAIEELKILKNTLQLTVAGKMPALHNLFYLAGYVLESISTYTIYKHYNWPITKSVKECDTRFSNICSFSFYQKHGYPYFASGHNFQDNQFEVLKVIFSNSGIPFLDSSINVDLEIQALFNQWKAELRYHDFGRSYPFLFNRQLNVSERNVYGFVKISKEIYNGLLQIVG